MTVKLVHGTCISIAGRGVLLRGPSGSGKSDLALRLIESGARLVADDQVSVRVMRGRLVAGAPQNLRGLIEVRGVGIIPMKAAARAPLALVVDLVAAKDVPRLPEPSVVRIEGVALPRVMLAPFEASAAIKVRLALRFGAGSTATARRPRRRVQRTTSR
jgi:serine kinase of HPr protein (carbohydrate metabolism regulator)